MPPSRSSSGSATRRSGRWATWNDTLRAGIDQGRYDAAPTCELGAAEPCRWHGEGTVTDLGTSSGRYSTSYWVKVGVASDGTLMAYVDRGVWMSLTYHQPVRVETWNGQLTRIDDAETQDNPDWNVSNGRGLLLLSGGAVILGSILLGLWFIRWRHRVLEDS